MPHAVCCARPAVLLSRSIGFRYASTKVAIIGSGPAGFYTAQKLLKNPKIKVDIFERLPVPFGLVRYGVAPDHQDVKNVINSFTNVANNDRVDFYGNVNLGQDIKLDDLIDAYHAVVLCYGSAQDKLLNIDGESSAKNMISARNFVGWYNGVPADKDLMVDLDCDTACIVGHGNVALDCARILLKPANLDKTDITSYAHSILCKSKIKRIFIIGRRGPFQVSFTTKELRELIKLNESGTVLDPSTIFTDANLTQQLLKHVPRPRRRLIELLLNISANRQVSEKVKSNGIELIFKFLSKPVKIMEDEVTGLVTGLQVKKTRYIDVDEFMNQIAHPVETGESETIKCGLLIRSVGYRAVMVDKSLPLDIGTGAIINTDGRIAGHRNMYCSGWLATGAVGVIAGTLNSSHVTAQSILDDIEHKNLPNLSYIKPGYESIDKILRAKSIQVVHFNDWLRIDEVEKRLGMKLGKNREKLVDIDEMLELAKKD